MARHETDTSRGSQIRSGPLLALRRHERRRLTNFPGHLIEIEAKNANALPF
jgi:hypothetical protein